MMAARRPHETRDTLAIVLLDPSGDDLQGRAPSCHWYARTVALRGQGHMLADRGISLRAATLLVGLLATCGCGLSTGGTLSLALDATTGSNSCIPGSSLCAPVRAPRPPERRHATPTAIASGPAWGVTQATAHPPRATTRRMPAALRGMRPRAPAPRGTPPQAGAPRGTPQCATPQAWRPQAGREEGSIATRLRVGRPATQDTCLAEAPLARRVRASAVRP
jgi:hypothetical protein